MPAITKAIQIKRAHLMDKVLKAFALVDMDDQTEITFQRGMLAYPTLIKMQAEIIKTFPKRNTSRLRKGVKRRDLHTIRVLKEMLRYYNMTLMSYRQQTRKGCIYKYKIAK